MSKMGTLKANNASKIKAMLMAIYTASYLCRYSYATVLPEMVKSTGKTKTELSVAVTCLFVCYGIGQLISGFLGDRVPPKRLIIAGMASSICLNCIVPFVHTTWIINVIWCLNGLSQAFIWPPVVALLAALLTSEEYSKGVVWVSYGGYLGTILLYLLSPLFIRLWSWQGTFIFSGVCGLIIILFFAFSFPDVPPVKPMKKSPPPAVSGEHDVPAESSPSCDTAVSTKPASSPEPQKNVRFIALISPSLIIIMLCIIAQGFIKDGITTWMPTYISELFNIDSAASILTGVLLPVFAMICLKLANVLNRKAITNPITCAAALFGAGAVCALALFIIKSGAAPLTVLFSVLLTGSMHGVNLMLICMLPLYFKETGNVSTASGLLNFTTYVGSSASAYVLAAMSENMSWNTIFLIIAAIAFIAGIVCILVRNYKAGIRGRNK